MEYITLYNGNKSPVIGIGTFMITPADAEVMYSRHPANGQKKTIP